MPNSPLMARIAKHAAFVKEIEVPEWGVNAKEPLVFYAPAMKASVYEECRSQATNKGEIDMSMFRALLVYRQAQDADGKKLFSLTDVADLKNADADTLTRVAEQVTKSATIEQLEKN